MAYICFNPKSLKRCFKIRPNHGKHGTLSSETKAEREGDLVMDVRIVTVTGLEVELCVCVCVCVVMMLTCWRRTSLGPCLRASSMHHCLDSSLVST